jgi:hypothetical protein
MVCVLGAWLLLFLLLSALFNLLFAFLVCHSYLVIRIALLFLLFPYCASSRDITINCFNVSLESHRPYMEIFMDMGMLLMVHTLLLVPQFQRLMARCLAPSTSIQLHIFSLPHQFLPPLKATCSLL